jgi:hypothetical protein
MTAKGGGIVNPKATEGDLEGEAILGEHKGVKDFNAG